MKLCGFAANVLMSSDLHILILDNVITYSNCVYCGHALLTQNSNRC